MIDDLIRYSCVKQIKRCSDFSCLAGCLRHFRGMQEFEHSKRKGLGESIFSPFSAAQSDAVVQFHSWMSFIVIMPSIMHVVCDLSCITACKQMSFPIQRSFVEHSQPRTPNQCHTEKGYCRYHHLSTDPIPCSEANAAKHDDCIIFTFISTTDHCNIAWCICPVWHCTALLSSIVHQMAALASVVGSRLLVRWPAHQGIGGVIALTALFTT